MQIEELSYPTYSATNPGGNYTNNGYPTRTPTTNTPPANATATAGLQKLGDGVIAMGDQGELSARGMLLVPYGAGVATNTFSLKVLGWRATNMGGVPLWVPTVLGTWAVTLGTGTGIANADLTTTALFATTITMTGGPTFVTAGPAAIAPDWFQISPTGNDIGAIFVRSFGFRFLETIYTTGGSATSCNALYCRY